MQRSLPSAPAPIGEAIAGALRAQQAASPPPLPPAATVGELWSRIIAAAQENRRVRVVLEDLAPIAWDEGVLRLQAAVGTQLAAESVRAEIVALANAQAGLGAAKTPIDVRIEPAQPAPGPSDAAALPASEVVAQHPLVQQTISLLGARVVGVQPRKPSSS